MTLPSSHPSERTLTDYHARRLPPDEVLAVSDHLAGCADCREVLARLGAGGGAPEFLPEDDGAPGYEEMAALLDGELSPAQADDVRSRLEASPQAAAEFADLQAFRDELAVSDSRTAAGAGKIVAFPGWVQFALSAAAVVLVSAGWWHFSRLPDPGKGLLVGRVDLNALPADLRQSVLEAERTGRMEPAPPPPELRPPGGTLAGEASAPNTLEQVTPVGTVVREDRPRLQWKGRPDATGYVVYLAGDGSNGPVARKELSAGQTEWTPATPLKRGEIYEWQIEARRGDEVIDRAPRPPAPEARFEVLDASAAAGLENVERAAGGDPLVLGTAYARAGLRAAAAGQFRELARRHPKSAVAGKLSREATGASIGEARP